ncbi:MAG: recombinase family protein [Chloroflexi bacterium]|nr:recombinase family protein [Chloroflexota bacterium]
MDSPKRAAVWLRVSDKEQELDNQRVKLDDYCRQHNLEVVRTCQLDGVSGYADDPRYNAHLADCLEAARRREFDVLLVWALDRLTRRGVEHLCTLMRRFDEAGVRVISLQEPWTEVGGELRELLVAVTAWAARFESQRISQRTKAGLARRKAQGLPVGRQPGAKDRIKGSRKRSGYHLRWERSRSTPK